MTARTVLEDLDLPSGVSPTQITVEVYLAGVDGALVREAYISASNKTVVGKYQFAPAADGTWTLDLEPNANINPAGTVYARKVYSNGSGPVTPSTVYFTVPDTSGSHVLEDILDDPPGTLASSALAAHIADVTPQGHVPAGGALGQVLTWQADDSVAWGAAGAASIVDTAYGSGWDGQTTTAPSRNAVYDKIESLIAAVAAAYQPLDADLTAVAALTTTSFGRALLELANAAAGRTALGLGTASTSASTDFQPIDSDLTAIAALTTTSFGRSVLALADAAALRTLAGLGTMATATATDYVAKTLWDANTVLYATTDDTPVALTVGASTVVGRKSSGNIVALTNAELAAILAGEVFKQAQEVNAQTGTTYTLVAGDAGKLVTLSNASAITLTLPQDSDATIAVGTYVDLYQLGAGQVTVAAGTGATLRTSGLTAKARAQYARLSVQKVSANTWSLMGDLSAS